LQAALQMNCAYALQVAPASTITNCLAFQEADAVRWLSRVAYRTRELANARLVDASEALRMGLVNQVFPQDSFMQSVYAYAKDLANNVSPRSLRVIKEQVYNGMFQTLSEAFEGAEQEMVKSLQCEDFKEGVAHFLEKRAPAFTGR